MFEGAGNNDNLIAQLHAHAELRDWSMNRQQSPTLVMVERLAAGLEVAGLDLLRPLPSSQGAALARKLSTPRA